MNLLRKKYVYKNEVMLILSNKRSVGMALLYIALVLCLIGILIGILSIIGIIVLYKSI